MPQQVQGVIARAKDAPVELVTVNVPDPGPGEAVVADPGLRGVPHRPALPARAGSATTSRTCSATRRPAWWRPSATVCETSSRATT